jgi:hypothetical protein
MKLKIIQLNLVSIQNKIKKMNLVLKDKFKQSKILFGLLLILIGFYKRIYFIKLNST